MEEVKLNNEEIEKAKDAVRRIHEPGFPNRLKKFVANNSDYKLKKLWRRKVVLSMLEKWSLYYKGVYLGEIYFMED